MKCLVVDDEPIARVRLKGMLAKIDAQYSVIEAENGEEAIQMCNEYRPQLVLLDIQMPGISGLEVAMHLALMDNPPAVIFITAYNEHALDAFEANAIDYLLKPVRKERLQQALAKVTPLTRKNAMHYRSKVRVRMWQ